MPNAPSAGRVGDGTRWVQALVVALSLLGPVAAPAASALSDDELAAARQAVIDSFDPRRLGAGYAALVSFAVSPQISTASFRPDTESDGAEDTQLDVYRIPLRFVFGEDENVPRPFVQAVLAYQDLYSRFDLGFGESIRSDWETYGLLIDGGFEVPLSDNLILLPTLSLGYARLENTADYSGLLSETVLRPAFKNIIFDWKTDAVVYGAALGMDYRRQFGGFTTELLASVSRNRLETVNESSEFVEFSSGVTALDVEFNTAHATGLELQGHPLDWVLLLGHTRFYGSNRDSLGFTHFSEAGLALQLSPRPGGHRNDIWRLGLKTIVGDDVDGWSLVLSHEF
ncbi:hypothetical protein GCM10011348_12490 [Marinobacterium nitratireducens]|uniref:Uncharacterized protein n=1 Tax=Marinobacterium nitratireducens TaxID=518897 RepID=A0A918DR98_9GAMM|nr:hypothetical protein [Marinobacterium nitratireducens]GGO79081.1 hypothetical protein GCM10011348_12490 [Marinobacterium nitratireducens]